MTGKRDDRPSNLRSLTTRLDNLAREEGRPVRRIQRTVANTVVGQMIEKVLEHWPVPVALREFIANAVDEQTITGTVDPTISIDAEGRFRCDVGFAASVGASRTIVGRAVG
jgi:hypothetical protein